MGPTANENAKFNEAVRKAIAKQDGVDLTPQWRKSWTAHYNLCGGSKHLLTSDNLEAFVAAVNRFQHQFPNLPITIHLVEEFK